MSSRKERMQVGREATDRRLRLQIALFSVVFIVVSVLVVVRVVSGGIDPFWPLLGFAAGLLVGVILARTKSLGWDAPDHTVVSSMSVLGIIVTLAYLILKLLPFDLVSRVVADPETASLTGLAVTAGVMLGRTIFTLRDIRRLLSGAGVLDGPRS